MQKHDFAPGVSSFTRDHRDRIEQEFRVPVDAANPGTYWIACLDYESLLPTDEELRQLRSYIEFAASRIYREHVAMQMLAAPLAKCDGHNTVVFHKRREDGGWIYRRISWSEGPFWVPSWTASDYRVHTFVEVVDRIERTIPAQWTIWKGEHADIFPAAPCSAAS